MAIKTLTLVLDSIAAECLVVTTARVLASDRIRKQRNMVPSLPSGNGAVQPYGEGLVQVRVQGGEHSLFSGRQRAEWGGRVAARRSARAANGDNGLSVLFPGVVVVLDIVVVPGGVVLPAVLFPGVYLPAALWEGGDDAGHGHGGEERDDRFVEEHCNECGMKAIVVFSICLVGWY